MSATPRTDGRPSLLMIVVLLAALALFFVRGPLRAMRGGGGDFAAPYVAGLRFLRGSNPYSTSDFEADWHAAGARTDAVQNASGRRPVYPPSTLLLMGPFSILPWTWALDAYELLCSILYAGLLIRLAARIGPSWNSATRTAFVVYGLALAPVHTGLGVGNVSTLALLLAIFCLLFGRAQKNFRAGMLLGLCLCLKPTAGVFLLFYWLVCQRFRLVSWAIGLVAVISALSLLRMRAMPAVWVQDYQANLSFLFGPAGVANFTAANGYRFDLLNLQVPLFELTRSVSWANTLSWMIVGILLSLWLLVVLRRGGSLLGTSWAAPGVLLLLGLLPIYQRNYNAGFVLLAVFWSFEHLHTLTARWILGLGVIFLVPGEALLRRLGEHLPAPATHGFLMNFLVMPQATWALLAICSLLLFGLWRVEAPNGHTADYR